MIETADERLVRWARTTLTANDGAAPAVSLDPPALGADGAGISLYLMELGTRAPARSGRRSALQVELRYLVTAWGGSPEEAHRLLGALLVAALESEQFETELEPSPASLWSALGLPPRPSFCLRVPLRVEREQPPTPLVRQPLVVRTRAQ